MYCNVDIIRRRIILICNCTDRRKISIFINELHSKAVAGGRPRSARFACRRLRRHGRKVMVLVSNVDVGVFDFEGSH